MKVYIRSMSLSRDTGITRIKSFTKHITDNIVKLGIYKNSTRDQSHWLDELATWFSDINKVTLKPKRKKFSKSEYEEWVFGEFGDEISDVRSCIHAWQLNNQKTNRYDDIAVPEDSVEYTFLLVAKLKSYCLDVFTTVNAVSRKEILETISQFVRS